MIEDLLYDLEHGGEIEPGMLTAINMHIPNARHVISSQIGGSLLEANRETPHLIASQGVR